MVNHMDTRTVGDRRHQKQGSNEEYSTAPRLEPLAYRIADACHVLGVGRTSLYDLIKSGELRSIKIAGRTLVPRSEIERLTSVDRAA